MAKITIKDVARRAGVQPSTVSRAIHNHPDIKPATRARILQTIEELGFIPDRAAQSFRTGKNHSVSVMLPSPGNDFYIRLINAIDEVLEQHDYDAAVFPMLSQRRLARYQNPQALPYQTDGLMLVSLDPEQLYDDLQTLQGLPTVVLEVHSRHFDSVTLNNPLGGKLAAQHLQERPAETFVMCYAPEPQAAGVPSSGVFEERLQGFLQFFEKVGTPVPLDHQVRVNFDWPKVQEAARTVLSRRQAGPFNVFAVCDLFAHALLEEIREQGLTLGEDVRLVGYDLEPHPSGTASVHQAAEEMGRRATEMLMERILQPDLPIRHVQVDPVLKVGRS